MPTYPRHLTLPEEERARLVPARGGLIKAHNGTVTYPDRAEGTFSYERLGPAFHRFWFYWKDRTVMPRLYLTEPLGNDPRTIERKAQELAEKAFQEAIKHERRHVFARVSYEHGETTAKLKFLWRLCACQAREHGGKYAICLRIGSHWVRLSTVYDTIDQAADRWRDRVHDGAMICCCHRRHRRWQRPRFDPLNAEPEYGKADVGKEAESCY